MGISLEGKVRLGREFDDKPVDFVIVRNEDGWFSFEYRSSEGKTLAPVPLTDWDLRDISEALAWLGEVFDETRE